MTRPDMSLEFDPRIADWLEDDPDHAPEAVLTTVLAAFPSIPQRRARVPWRSFPMNRPAFASAAAAAVAVVALGGFMLSRPTRDAGGAPTPPAVSASPSPSSSPSPDLPALDTPFNSPFAGYSLRRPASWTVTPAPAAWKNGYDTESVSDRIGQTPSFYGTSRKLPAGTTFETWFDAYDADRATGTCGAPSDNLDIAVEGLPGRLDVHCPENYIEAVVPKGGRVYVFTMYTPYTRDLFGLLLGSVRLTPETAVDGPMTACDLLTASEVGIALGSGGFGAAGSASGAGAQSKCTFVNGPGEVILRVTATTAGGAKAFAAAKGVAGSQVQSGIGTDAVYDSGSATLSIVKGDVMIAIEAGTQVDPPARRLALATTLAKLIAARI
jgi:hypothetical protein